LPFSVPCGIRPFDLFSLMPRQVHIAFNLLAITAIVFIGVDVFYRILGFQLDQFDSGVSYTTSSHRDIRQKGSEGHSYQVIVDRNLFGAARVAERQEQSVEEIINLAPTTLQVRLLGTIAGDEKNGRAIIEDSKREQGLYRVGDDIQGAVINRILRGKVVLRVNGRDEILTMADKEDSGGQTAAPVGRPARTSSRAVRRASSRDENTVTLSQDDITESLNNINDIITQVRVEPHMVDGVAQGLIVKNIAAGSIFERMGLADGDIVQAVNRRPIKSPDDVVALYQSLKSARRLNLQVTRGGQPQTLNYNIR
jgi:general secretion pathway protein C